MRYLLIIALLFSTATAQNTFFGVLSGSGNRFDPDAKAYLDAAGITDSAQRQAFNVFVKGMKSNGLWTKALAIYPFMGGSASSHVWNAKDPRDLNIAYRLEFVNGATHNSNGVTYNGTTQYTRTFFNPKGTIADSNSYAFGIYNRTDNSRAATDMGGASNSSTTSTSIYLRWTDNNFYGELYSPSNRVTVSNTNATGMYLLSRASSTSLKAYRNGSQIGSTVTTANTTRQTDTEILIGAIQVAGSGIFNYSNRNYCFAIIMNTGLSDSEASTLSSLVNTLQTALGRNTY